MLPHQARLGPPGPNFFDLKSPTGNHGQRQGAPQNLAATFPFRTINQHIIHVKLPYMMFSTFNFQYSNMDAAGATKKYFLDL
jgi:hypothetical protein